MKKTELPVRFFFLNMLNILLKFDLRYYGPKEVEFEMKTKICQPSVFSRIKVQAEKESGNSYLSFVKVFESTLVAESACFYFIAKLSFY